MQRLLLAALAALGLTAGAARAANPVVVVDTSLGSFKVELFEKEAPQTVKNFLNYVDNKFYDGTIFHRVMGKPYSKNDFMIQGGGFEPGLKEKKTGDPIKNEASPTVPNKRGTIAMARTPDPDSATAQFFVNVADNDFLNRDADYATSKDPDKAGYCAFGKVIEGMDVVDKIKAVEVKDLNAAFKRVPTTDVVIKSIRRADK
jgi:cyclophilin family peptidyl-prolyl cis-trans isomerase